MDSSVLVPIKKFGVYVVENLIDSNYELQHEQKIEKETVQVSSLKPYFLGISLTLAAFFILHLISRNFMPDSSDVIQAIINQQHFNSANFKDLSDENIKNFVTLTEHTKVNFENTNQLIKEIGIKITENVGKLIFKPINSTDQMNLEQLVEYYAKKGD